MTFPVLSLFLALFSVHAQSADIERCIDSKGHAYYTESCQANRMAHDRKVADRISSAEPQARNAGNAGNAIRFYYSRLKEPWGVKHYEMDDILKFAAAAWSHGCGVRIEYAGVANYGNDEGAPVVRWSNELWAGNLKSRNGVKVLGRAGKDTDVSLTTDADMNDPGTVRRVVLHELGHVLGIGHITSNPRAIMYPTQTRQNRNVFALSPEDRYACKQALFERSNGTRDRLSIR
jgi:hypothetical protein